MDSSFDVKLDLVTTNCLSDSVGMGCAICSSDRRNRCSGKTTLKCNERVGEELYDIENVIFTEWCSQAVLAL